MDNVFNPVWHEQFMNSKLKYSLKSYDFRWIGTTTITLRTYLTSTISLDTTRKVKRGGYRG